MLKLSISHHLHQPSFLSSSPTSITTVGFFTSISFTKLTGSTNSSLHFHLHSHNNHPHTHRHSSSSPILTIIIRPPPSSPSPLGRELHPTHTQQRHSSSLEASSHHFQLTLSASFFKSTIFSQLITFGIHSISFTFIHANITTLTPFSFIP